MKQSQKGFSLIEVAVVLFILVLLLGSLMIPLATQVEQRQVSETEKNLENIRDALLGFAVTNGYLPCPAISATNGLEDRTGGVCTGGKRDGYIPWETLGVSKADAWGHMYRYSVTLAYASSAIPFTLASPPDITIRTRNTAGALVNLTNANIVSAIVMSHGKNGFGSVNTEAIAQALPGDWPASNVDENTNSSGTTTFVSRIAQAANAGGVGGEFDDIVFWLPRYTLVNRMVTAGKLP